MCQTVHPMTDRCPRPRSIIELRVRLDVLGRLSKQAGGADDRVEAERAALQVLLRGAKSSQRQQVQQQVQLQEKGELD